MTVLFHKLATPTGDTSGAGVSTVRPAPSFEMDAEIVRYCIAGKLTYEQIADRLGMTDKQLRKHRKRLGLSTDPLKRIAAFNRRHKGTTGRFAGLINSENNASDRLPNGDGTPRSHPFNHEQTNNAGRV